MHLFLTEQEEKIQRFPLEKYIPFYQRENVRPIDRTVHQILCSSFPFQDIIIYQNGQS